MPNLTGVPSAAEDLAMNPPSTPEELARRKKKLMGAANSGNDMMGRFGNAASMLLGSRSANAPM